MNDRAKDIPLEFNPIHLPFSIILNVVGNFCLLLHPNFPTADIINTSSKFLSSFLFFVLLLLVFPLTNVVDKDDFVCAFQVEEYHYHKR